MVRIKVCGMNDTLNVKAISETGIDFIGYIFYPLSGRYVGRRPDKQLFKRFSDHIKRVGVFVNEDLSVVQYFAEYADLDSVQLHGNESVRYCEDLKKKGLDVIKTFGVRNDFDPGETDIYSEVCDYFLFDNKNEEHGGTGEKFNWSLIKDYPFRKPFFLGGGISRDDTEMLSSFKNKQFFAIDINSRFESSPGVKDVEMVKYFVNKIKNITI